MIIANPIYDAVFKFLVEDPKAAKILISVITSQKIKHVDLRPQELMVASPSYGMTVFRVDFKAIVEMADGSEKKILVEIQKSSHPDDIPRFRRYLGENYSNPDKVKDDEMTLPITTIYFLGFNLTLTDPAIKVNREYINLISREVISQKDNFIELLSHDSYILQLRRLPTYAQSRLEQFLLLFNQKWAVDDQGRKWLLNLPDNLEIADEEMIFLMKRLNLAASRKEVQDQVRIEEDFDRSLDVIIREKEEQVLMERKAKEKERKAKEKERKAKEKEREAKEKEREAKEALQVQFINTIKNLHHSGISLDQIVQITKKSKEEILEILEK